MDIKKCCICIPSYEPDEKMVTYVDELTKAGFGGIIIVDDGSGLSYKKFFEEVALLPKVTVVTHEINKGKGRALKTGIEFIKSETDFDGIIMADSDGQHTVQDTLKLAKELDENAELLLGSRDFSRRAKNVPFKSRFGNRLTSMLFKLLYGKYLPDTQTGLRAISRNLYDEMLAIGGERFEYEMNVLIYCAQKNIQMKVIPIETIYHNENKGTHFNPITDSFKIYKLIFAGFIKFSLSGILSWITDQVLFNFLRICVLGYVISYIAGNQSWDTESIVIFVSYVIARIGSACLNYNLNRKYVFGNCKSQNSFGRYFILWLLVLIVGSVSTTVISSFDFMNVGVIKIIIDLIIVFFTYRIQQTWVFREKG